VGKLFGTDGIRGEANQYPMDAMTAFSVGQAVTHLFKTSDHQSRVIIGKDTRISGDMLEDSLGAGIISMGGTPYLVGVLPTPGIAFATRSMDADAGIVISASHNPYQDNGIKIFSGDGFKLSDEQERIIEGLVSGGRLPSFAPSAKGEGSTKRRADVFEEYVAFLKDTFPGNLSLAGKKIIIDAANGATYRVAPRVFADLGAEIKVIHDKPNGININDNCGSQYTQDLQERVRKGGADMGLAFDGDGDRLIAIDERGRRITGDQSILICAKALKDEAMLRNDLVVTTVMSNLGLVIACKKFGFRHHASKVGDRYVLEDMRRLGAMIGGENSGHLIFLDHHTTGDGILAALQLIAAMLKEGKTMSQLASLMDIYPQKLINVEVLQKPEISTVPQIVEAIKVVERGLGEKGRVLVRYSGTQNLCRIMVEGPTEDLTEKYCNQVARVVKEALG